MFYIVENIEDFEIKKTFFRFVNFVNIINFSNPPPKIAINFSTN